MSAQAFEYPASITQNTARSIDVEATISAFVPAFETCENSSRHNDALQRLSALTLISCRQLFIDEPSIDISLHRAHSSLYLAEMHYGTSFIEATASQTLKARARMVSFPGLSEDVRHPFNKLFNDALLGQFPGWQGIALGSNGIGIRGKHDTSTRSETSQDRFELLANTATKKPHVLVGRSMGATFANDIVNKNLDEKKPALNIDKVIYLAPALIEPSSAHIALIKFLPRLLADGLNEARHQEPYSIYKGLGYLASWGVQTLREESPSVSHQARELFKGTQQEEVDRVVAHYKTLVVTGANDTLANVNMWQNLKEKYPDNLRLVIVPKHGHEMLFDPERAAAKIAKELAA
jgi:pimeloyl-ACP methyl ester carboxylesterase